MTYAESIGPIIADPHTPRTFGVLNIVYALGLMAGGLCVNMGFLGPSLMSYVAVKMGEQESQRSQTRQVQIEKWNAEEKAALDEKTKSEIRERREDAEAEPNPIELPFQFMADPQFRDPRIMGHFVFDLLSGLVLNLLMFVAGLGLFWLKNWGRILATLIAYAKVLRLLVLALSMSFVIAPIVANLVTAIEAALPEPGVASVSSQIAIYLAGISWFVFVVGSIYPVITIAELRRPSVRESFRNARGELSS